MKHLNHKFIANYQPTKLLFSLHFLPKSIQGKEQNGERKNKKNFGDYSVFLF